MRLTKRNADSIKPTNTDVCLWDSGRGSVPGLGLRVRAISGSKTFVFMYRNRYGKYKRLTLGRYGFYTIVEARKKAEEAAAIVAAGGDPSEEKQRDRTAWTVNKLLDEYLKSGAFASKADTTRSVDRGRIERHLRPLLGKKILKELKPEDVRKAFSAIRDGKTATDIKTGHRGRAIVTGGEGAARMAIRVLRAILTWAVREGLAEKNPAMGIPLGTDGVRTAVISTHEEYTRLFRALDKLEEEQRIRAHVADCIRVLTLTGARRNEISAMRWSWVDLKRGVLTVPATAHKTGKKTGTKEVALPTAAQQIIKRQPEGKSEDYVFPPASGRGPVSLTKPWKLVREEAGLPDDLGLHGLRHSLATQMAIQGAGAPEIMSALGHRQLSTAARYIKSVDEARRDLMEKHTAGISAAMDGKESAKVVPIRREPGE